MASLRMLPNSPYWIACFTDAEGKRTQVSTKIPVKGLGNTQLAPVQKRINEFLGVTVSEVKPEGSLNRKEAKQAAQWIADQYEATARAAREKDLSEKQVRKVLADHYEKVNGTRLANSSTREFLNGWL